MLRTAFTMVLMLVALIAFIGLFPNDGSRTRQTVKQLTELSLLDSCEYFPVDAWGNHIFYNNTKGYIDVVSPGPDGLIMSPDDLVVIAELRKPYTH